MLSLTGGTPASDAIALVDMYDIKGDTPYMLTSYIIGEYIDECQREGSRSKGLTRVSRGLLVKPVGNTSFGSARYI